MLRGRRRPQKSQSRLLSRRGPRALSCAFLGQLPPAALEGASAPQLPPSPQSGGHRTKPAPAGAISGASAKTQLRFWGLGAQGHGPSILKCYCNLKKENIEKIKKDQASTKESNIDPIDLRSVRMHSNLSNQIN